MRNGTHIANLNLGTRCREVVNISLISNIRPTRLYYIKQKMHILMHIPEIEKWTLKYYKTKLCIWAYCLLKTDQIAILLVYILLFFNIIIFCIPTYAMALFVIS